MQNRSDMFTRVSGSATDGEYTVTITFPRYSQTGTWNVVVVVNSSDDIVGTHGLADRGFRLR